MVYKQLPNTDLVVSAICLGCGNFGSGQDEKMTGALLDAFMFDGGNFLDTANIYGKWVPGKRALSEIILGNWLQYKKNRDKLMIGTKGGHPELEAMEVPRLSPQEIVSDLEESLTNLQTDYIDLYWLHRDDPNRPVEEMIHTLNQQIKLGKIRYIGCSNWSVSRIREAMEYCDKMGIQGFIANQNQWNLAVTNQEAMGISGMQVMDEEGIKLHCETGLTAIPYNSQASGFFTKALRADFDTNPLYDEIKRKYKNDETMKRVERVRMYANEFGVDGTQIALAFLLNQPFTTVPIVGCRNKAQLKGSLMALDIRLDW